MSLKDFYLGRIFRLYPALLFFLIIVVVFNIISGQKIIIPDVLSGLFYFTNYYLVYFKPAFLSSGYPLVSEILWSLSVEEHFYLFFPVLFLIFFSEKNNRLLSLLGLLLLFFLCIRCIEFVRSTDQTEAYKTIYYTTHNRGDSILFGCVSAILIYRSDQAFYLKCLKSGYGFLLAVALLFIAEAATFPFFQSTTRYTFQGLSFAIMVPSFLFFGFESIMKKLVEGKWIVFLGKLSHSLYLFHWISMKIVNFYIPQNDIMVKLLTVALSIGLALLSYYGVERTFLTLRRRFGSHAK